MPIEAGPQSPSSYGLPSNWLRYGTGSATAEPAAAAVGATLASVVRSAIPIASTPRIRTTSGDPSGIPVYRTGGSPRDNSPAEEYGTSWVGVSPGPLARRERDA